MYTLKDTLKPSPEYLRQYISAECPDQDDETIISNALNCIADGLSQSPRMYRGYGAYWPAIKNLLIERLGFTEAGLSVDHDVLSIYSYDNYVYTLAAAFLYYSHRLENGQIYSTKHDLPVDSYETYEFNYSDDEIELNLTR
ncbi:MAG: peptide-binding protein [Plesiomonas sp.]